MNKMGERFLIYTALSVLCVLTAAFAGSAAAFWSFVQVVAVIELIYWLAQPVAKSPLSES
jgi:hypothetical protein